MENDLLAPESADQIATLCRTAIGDSLRSVTYFTRDDFEQLYLRGDLEQDADLMDFIGHEWQDFKNTQNAYSGSELGEYKFTVRAFENGYLVRVATDREGVFATTDSLTLQQYEEVATAISEILEER
ncbi:MULTISPECIES: hypothetical protein [Halostella]|uniref:DUF7522 family protein n=1 Tax=Halostella TaxID=1843185 RepID=UPI001081E658|nr:MULTISPECIES: hypothetical protein [Halostella]